MIDTHKYLQRAFFIDNSGSLFSCDEDGNDFLSSIDIDLFFSHLQSLHLNTACTSSTIIIEKTSYNIRLIPISLVLSKNTGNYLEAFKEGYIVILQNQSFFSSIIQQMNIMNFASDQYSNILNTYSDGIFVTKADGTALFENSRYQEITQIDHHDIIGKSIYTMESMGVFTPLVTPTILNTQRDYSVFQSFESGKFALISGTPVFDTSGNTMLILICVTSITNDKLIQISKDFFDSPNKPTKELYQTTQIDVIAESNEMRKVLQDLIRVAYHDVPIFLLGESGTGKEVFSSIIHASSRRRFNPCLTVNCSALSSSLLDAELFGYEAGAFTGALPKGKAGLFETADNGTLFLDEIGDMPLETQAKILRTVQNGEVYRVGGWTPIKVNVRIIAATNKDIKKMVREGTFRSDLYHRLNVVSVNLPPLRKRKSDITPLLQHFCYVFNKKYSANKVLSQNLLNALTEYPWLGNVRELKNAVERMVVLCLDNTLEPDHFFKMCIGEDSSEDEIQNSGESIIINGIPPLAVAIQTLERTIVSRALTSTATTRQAAALINVSQSTIMRKIKEYGL